MAQNTKCPARYKNLGLETFGNKRKVTDEMLKQFCKNDEFLYQQIRILLDLTDPESRKRFHPPYFEDEIKSFGYMVGWNKNKPCYMFDKGGEYKFRVNFNTKDDDVTVIEGITYFNDESIIDTNKSQGVDIIVENKNDDGYVRIHQEKEINEITQDEPVFEDVETSTTVQTTKEVGSPTLDSYCYGPYGGMKPNGWWYVGYDINKNYSIKSEWRKNHYQEGIPSVCRAQTFIAQHTGYVTRVNLNIISESNKNSASPFSCEIWKTDKNGAPTGGAIARVEKNFIDSNAYSGAHIKTFEFDKKVAVTKGEKYAIVMRSPLSYRDSCYRIAGWPRNCYTNYMTGTYFYGAAYRSSDNGKTWIKYDKNAYGVLNANISTMPVAFGFEVYVQPTENVPVSTTTVTRVQTGTRAVVVSSETRDVYEPVGNHYIYFNLPATNPIYQLSIDMLEGEEIGTGNSIEFDISYNGKNFSKGDNDFKLKNDMDRGMGDYDLSNDKPTFVTVRCNLKNTDRYSTPTIRSVLFTVHIKPSRKAYVRSLPYCPESEMMLPACIWSEVNAEYEEEKNASVKVDIIREVEAQQIISIRKDTLDDLWSYYQEYYPTKKREDFTEKKFRQAIQSDVEFIEYLKTLEPPVYVISQFALDHEDYYEYFENIQLPHYPAYPLLACNKLLGEQVIRVDDFYDSIYNNDYTQCEVDLGRDLSNDLINVTFREPMDNDKLEGVVENVLELGADYELNESKRGIIFNLTSENFQRNVIFRGDGKVKCFKLSDGTPDVVDGDMQNDRVAQYTGNVVELVANLRDKSFTEHMNYNVDYNNKTLIPKTSMRVDLSSCELLISYNPLWIRDLTTEEFPLRMDMWTESFTVDENSYDENGKLIFETRVTPRDNLREVVLWDEEDSLTRMELVEDKDFVVDYQKNMITFIRDIDVDTPVTIRYTPNLIDTSLSIAYRLDRDNEEDQAYVYSNYFTTRT